MLVDRGSNTVANPYLPYGIPPYAPVLAGVGISAAESALSNAYEYATKSKRRKLNPTKRTTVKYGGGGYKKDARSGKRSTGRKGVKGRPRPKKSLKDRVVRLERDVVDPATRIVKKISTSQKNCSPNVCSYSTNFAWYPTQWEEFITDLRFIDRAATPAADTIDLSNQSYSHELDFRNIFLSYSGKNNGQIPMKLKVYTFECIGPTGANSTPTELMDAYDGVFAVSSSTTDILLYPSDMRKAWSDKWKILKTNSFSLNAGDEFSVSHSIKQFKYDVKAHDVVGSVYPKGCVLFVLRLQGVLCHDKTTTSEVGFSDSTIDTFAYIKYEIKYQSDASFTDMKVSSTLGTVTDAVCAGPNIVEIEETL